MRMLLDFLIIGGFASVGPFHTRHGRRAVLAIVCVLVAVIMFIITTIMRRK